MFSPVLSCFCSGIPSLIARCVNFNFDLPVLEISCNINAQSELVRLALCRCNSVVHGRLVKLPAGKSAMGSYTVKRLGAFSNRLCFQAVLSVFSEGLRVDSHVEMAAWIGSW